MGGAAAGWRMRIKATRPGALRSRAIVRGIIGTPLPQEGHRHDQATASTLWVEAVVWLMVW